MQVIRERVWLMEPYKLRRWKRRNEDEQLRVWTCARPGRSKGSTGKVKDSVVCQWLRNIPKEVNSMISLLGQKRDGMSEFAFYSFRSVFEVNRKPCFQDFINRQRLATNIVVHEFPTTDFETIPDDKLKQIQKTFDCLLHNGSSIILVDSGGEIRTKQVCRFLELVEDTRTLDSKNGQE